MSSVRILNEDCIGFSSLDRVSLVSIQTGEVLATFKFPPSALMIEFIFHKDRLICISQGSTVFCFKIISQDIIWYSELSFHPSSLMWEGLFIHPGDDPNDDVVIVCSSRQVVGLSLITGEQLWISSCFLPPRQSFQVARYLPKSREIFVPHIYTESLSDDDDDENMLFRIFKCTVPSVTTKTIRCLGPGENKPLLVDAEKISLQCQSRSWGATFFEILDDGVVLIGNYCKVFVENFKEGAIISCLDCPEDICCIAVIKDYVAFGSGNGRLHCYHTHNLKPVWNVPHGHLDSEKAITHLCFHPDHPNLLFSGGADGTIRRWKIDKEVKIDVSDHNADLRFDEVVVGAQMGGTAGEIDNHNSLNEDLGHLRSLPPDGDFTNKNDSRDEDAITLSKPTIEPKKDLGEVVCSLQRGVKLSSNIDSDYVYFCFLPSNGLASMNRDAVIRCWDISSASIDTDSMKERWCTKARDNVISHVCIDDDCELFFVGRSNDDFVQKWKMNESGVKLECCWVTTFPPHKRHELFLTKDHALCVKGDLHILDRTIGETLATLSLDFNTSRLRVVNGLLLSLPSMDSHDEGVEDIVKAWEIKTLVSASNQAVLNNDKYVGELWALKQKCPSWGTVIIPSTHGQDPPILLNFANSNEISLIDLNRGIVMGEIAIPDGDFCSIYAIHGHRGAILQSEDDEFMALLLPSNFGSEISIETVHLVALPITPIGRRCGTWERPI